MGIVSSLLPQVEYWTAEEKAANEASLMLQRSAAAFVTKYLFVDVPTKVTKLSRDPLSPLWIQIDTQKIAELDEEAENSAVFGGTSPNKTGAGGRYRSVDDRTFNSVPTGVTVNKSGVITILFEKESTGKLEYSLSVKDVQLAEMRAQAEPKPPQPPEVVDVGTRSIALKWQLPQPPGVVQAVEIFRTTPSRSWTGCSDDVEAAKWTIISKKQYDLLHFYEEVYKDLKPGSRHVYKMRYRDIRGWSDFSAPTQVLTTRSDVPAAPVAPKSGGVFPDAVSLVWQKPHSNGSPIERFILRGRPVGDEWVDLYQGTDMSHLIVGLHPGFAYSFLVVAVNGVGMSKESPMLSLQLPPRKTERGMNIMADELKKVAEETKTAWREFWDQKTGKTFYFNSITGVRTLDRPAVLGAAPVNMDVMGRGMNGDDGASNGGSESPSRANDPSRHGRGRRSTSSASSPSASHHEIPQSATKSGSMAVVDDDEAILIDREKMRKVRFRKKRFKLLMDIHQDKRDRAHEVSTVTRRGAAPLSPEISSQASSSSSMTALRNALEVKIRRDRLLKDGYDCLMSSSMDMLLKRTRVTFDGEEGIDSGGPSKEFFLLLSADAARFGAQDRSFLRKADAGGYFLGSHMPSRPPPSIPSPAVAAGEKKGPNPNNLEISIFDYAAFLGRLLGKAIFERQLVDFPLSHALLSAMLGHPEDSESEDDDEESSREGPGGKDKRDGGARKATKASVNESTGKESESESERARARDEHARAASMRRLKRLDLQLHTSLSWMLNNENVGEVLDQSFSVTNLMYPPNGGVAKVKELPLCKNGTDRRVTDENKNEYVKLRAEYETRYAVERTLKPFKEAFHELVPLDALRAAGIHASELEAMLNGKQEIDVEEVRAYTMFQGNISPDHLNVVWLWEILRESSDDDRRAFLRFVTGTSRVPLDGYDPPFNLTEGADMELGALPRAHTCFNQLVLPQYKNIGQMKDRLLFALKETEGFGMA